MSLVYSKLVRETIATRAVTLKEIRSKKKGKKLLSLRRKIRINGRQGKERGFSNNWNKQVK